MRSEKTRKIIFICVCALCALSFGANVFLALTLGKRDDSIKEYKKELGITGEQLESSLRKASDLKERIEALGKEIEEDKTRISELEKNREEIGREFEERISTLSEEIENKKKEMEELRSRLKDLEEVTNVDINSQLEVLKSLEDLLENPPDVKRTVTTEGVDQNGNKTYTETTVSSPSDVALCFYDLVSSYKYSYNGDADFYSASLVKLPYALGLYQAASDDKAAEEQTEAPDPSYVPLGLDTVFVYNSSMKQKGSGSIQYMPDGSSFTYLELVDYLVRVSDNVAFWKLSSVYGLTYLKAYLSAKDFPVMGKNVWHMSAKEAAVIAADVYSFVTTDPYYGPTLGASLEKSAHTVMAATAFYPKKVMHKYGWDKESYHDICIVGEDKPYVFVFMSDLEQGGTEVNEYIHKLAKLCDTLHDNFYSEPDN